MKILTTRGEVDIESLEINDSVELGDNHRKIATEYRLSGELVRRDVVVNVLRPLLSQSEQGRVG